MKIKTINIGITMRLNVALLITFLVITLSGCTHKRLITAGDDYLTQGKYQQAVEKYQRALNNKPNDKKTIQKFNQASSLFEHWLDTLENAALLAEQEKLFGKATILYAKLATHRHDIKYKQKQRQFHQRNLEQYGLRIKLNIAQPELSQAFGQTLDNILFIDKSSNKTNELTLSFILDDILFSTKNKANLETVEYISAYETIVNPEFEELQHPINSLQKKVKGLRKSVSRLNKFNDKQRIQYQLIDKDLQIAELKIIRVNHNSAVFRKLTQQIYNLKIDLVKQDKRISQTEKEIKSLQREIDADKRDLDDLYIAIQPIPKLIDVPIYREYQYAINTLTQTATSTLSVNSKSDYLGKISRHLPVNIHYSDLYHKAHKRIELGADPKDIKTRNQLTQMLYAKVRDKIFSVIEQNIKHYQQELIAKANNNKDIAQRLNQWLISGIISKQGLSSPTVNKVQLQLQNEFGQGGRFNINTLLSSN